LERKVILSSGLLKALFLRDAAKGRDGLVKTARVIPKSSSRYTLSKISNSAKAGYHLKNAVGDVAYSLNEVAKWA
jgi:hypothetical protein